MKNILIAIRPKWVEKIASGQKTIEVRKTAPKETPFKAYIYCTKGKPYLYRVDDDNNFELTNTLLPKVDGYVKDYNEQNGKVIGEFICDKVHNIEPIFRFFDNYSGYDDWSDSRFLEDYSIDEERLKKTCLTRRDLYIYGEEKTLYGWHISDLKLYDSPKKLSEFYTKKKCNSCKKSGYESTACMYDEDCKVPMSITRAPQSWQYVGEVEQ